MISFLHRHHGHTFRFQALNMLGWERLWVDEELISSRFNMSSRTEYSVQTASGKEYRVITLVEPDSRLMICRLYRQRDNALEHVCSLKQGKNHQLKENKLINIFGGCAVLASLFAFTL